MEREVLSLQNKLNEQQDRSLRSTLIFKKIPYNKTTETSWEDTKIVLASEISKRCPDFSFDYLKQSIERCHRNINNKGNNAERIPSISARFTSWKDSSNFLNMLINSNKKDKKNTLTVSQQYSDATTNRRNAALKERKLLIEQKKDMDYRVNYPAVLMGRKKNTNNRFTIIKSF